ncbi:MAG TPA: hypothetical protein PLW86_14425, partial [Rhodocyclaceae bacterium]|nr:hypothetical protein [Rhodocyclaceae bacterium]
MHQGQTVARTAIALIRLLRKATTWYAHDLTAVGDLPLNHLPEQRTDTMSETFSIILTGEILPEHNIRDVVPALAELLKTTEDQAIKRLTGRESVIKRNVAGTDVERYIKALSRVGVKARHAPSATVEDSPAAMAVVPRAPVAPALEPMRPKGEGAVTPAGDLVVCPQCGHEQPKRTLCLQCSCDMPRIRAAQAQMQTEEKASQSVYQAPRAALVDYGGDEDEEFATPEVLSFSMAGRLGRLRYMAYAWAFMLLVMLGGILAAILLPMGFKILFVPLIAVVIAVI